MVRTSNSRSKTSEAPAGGPRGRVDARAGGARRARGPTADRRWQERQRTILRAAAAVFREKGFEAAGMRDIAEAAGLSAANLYYYYGSKDELLYTCQDQALDRMLDAVRGARGARRPPRGPSRGPSRSDVRPVAERLRSVIEAQLRCMLEELEGGVAHLAVDALPPPLRARIVEKRDRYERALRALVAEGLRAGEFAACDPTLVTRAILGALNWTAQWYRQGGRTPLDALCAGFSDYLMRGLRA